jgi:hypothetical protein
MILGRKDFPVTRTDGSQSDRRGAGRPDPRPPPTCRKIHYGDIVDNGGRVEMNLVRRGQIQRWLGERTRVLDPVVTWSLPSPDSTWIQIVERFADFKIRYGEYSPGSP